MNMYNSRLQLLQPDLGIVSRIGEMNSIKILVTNTGSEVWYPYDKTNPILIGYSYSDGKGLRKEGIRTKLPYNISPGESVVVNCCFVIEEKLDKVQLRWDLIHEGKSWFEGYGNIVLETTVELNSTITREKVINDETAIVCSNLSKKFKMYSNNYSKSKELLTLGLVKQHNNFWALKDVSFEVKKGETYGIVGFNGSGKSTLLSILAQTKKQSHGSFKVNGRIAALLELGAGFHPELTGRQNVMFNSYLYGINSQEILSKIDSIQEFAGIGDFFEKPVKSYSSGMYVRLAFSLAIHVDPDVLIIDEALAVGDEVFQRKCYTKFEEFKAQGKTIVLVTHDLNAVRTLCDRASILYDGNLVFEGNSNDVANYYQKMSLTANLQITNHQDESSEKLRYGNGKARISSYIFFDEFGKETTVFSTGTTLRVKITAEAVEYIENPVIGIIFKTISGVEVYGTNTKELKCISPSVDKNDKFTTVFSIPNYLNEGTYFVTLGITDQSNGEIVTIDRLIDVTFVRVLSDSKCIGLVNLNVGGAAEINVN